MPQSEKVLEMLYEDQPLDGLFPIRMPDPSLLHPRKRHSYTDGAAGTVSFGAAGDSFYEYLVKLWIQVVVWALPSPLGSFLLSMSLFCV